MRDLNEMLSFSHMDSCDGKTIADGVTVRPFYLHSTCLALLEMHAGSCIPQHRHIHEQISYVLEGKIEVTVGGEVRILGKGEVFGVKSNLSHSIRALGAGAKMVVASSPLLQDYEFEKQ